MYSDKKDSTSMKHDRMIKKRIIRISTLKIADEIILMEGLKLSWKESKTSDKWGENGKCQINADK